MAQAKSVTATSSSLLKLISAIGTDKLGQEPDDRYLGDLQLRASNGKWVTMGKGRKGTLIASAKKADVDEVFEVLWSGYEYARALVKLVHRSTGKLVQLDPSTGELTLTGEMGGENQLLELRDMGDGKLCLLFDGHGFATAGDSGGDPLRAVDGNADDSRKFIGKFKTFDSSPKEEKSGAELQPLIYTVVSGDNLSKISKKFYGDPNKWRVVYEANRNLIKDPNLIQIGWKLKIPGVSPSPAPPKPAPPAPPPQKWAPNFKWSRVYVVRSGDNLSKIAKSIWNNANIWRALFNANRDIIKDPNVIQVGWKLRVPDEPNALVRAGGGKSAAGHDEQLDLDGETLAYDGDEDFDPGEPNANRSDFDSYDFSDESDAQDRAEDEKEDEEYSEEEDSSEEEDEESDDDDSDGEEQDSDEEDEEGETDDEESDDGSEEDEESEDDEDSQGDDESEEDEDEYEESEDDADDSDDSDEDSEASEDEDDESEDDEESDGEEESEDDADDEDDESEDSDEE